MGKDKDWHYTVTPKVPLPGMEFRGRGRRANIWRDVFIIYMYSSKLADKIHWTN